MSWFVLVVSGILEAVWATALGRSEGFTKLWPTLVFGIALIASMGGLALAMRDIAVGTAYAVWVGIGASLTVVYAMAFGGEPVSLAKVLLILGLIGCIIGLKLVDSAGQASVPVAAAAGDLTSAEGAAGTTGAAPLNGGR